MCCLALTAGFLGPRVALLAWWIFGNKVDVAFDTWLWPFLGLLFFPWTTLASSSCGRLSEAGRRVARRRPRLRG